jgi:hypothetical protein
MERLINSIVILCFLNFLSFLFVPKVPIQSVKEHLLEEGVEVRIPLMEHTTRSNQPEVGLTGAAMVV